MGCPAGDADASLRQESPVNRTATCRGVTPGSVTKRQTHAVIRRRVVRAVVVETHPPPRRDSANDLEPGTYTCTIVIDP